MFYYAKIDVTGLEVFMLMREMHLKNVLFVIIGIF